MQLAGRCLNYHNDTNQLYMRFLGFTHALRIHKVRSISGVYMYL